MCNPTILLMPTPTSQIRDIEDILQQSPKQTRTGEYPELNPLKGLGYADLLQHAFGTNTKVRFMTESRMLTGGYNNITFYYCIGTKSDGMRAQETYPIDQEDRKEHPEQGDEDIAIDRVYSNFRAALEKIRKE